MPRNITITFEDGSSHVYQNAPDNVTPEAVTARAEKEFGKTVTALDGGKKTAPATASASQEEAPVSMVERMFGAGSPLARTVKGAVVDPMLAVNQLLANTGLFGEDIKKGANQLVRNVESATAQGRERVGSTGFDYAQLLGAVVSPVNKVLAPAGAVKGAEAVARSVATGAGLASLSPVAAEDKDYAARKLEQMGVGAVLGPLTEAGIKSLGAIAGFVKGLTPSGRAEALRKYLDDLAGPEKEKVVTALREAKELVTGSKPTAAEALADVPTAAELVAAQRKLSAKPGIVGKFAAREAEQQAARVRALEGIAGTEAQRAAVTAERNAVTGTMRETALNQADVAGPVMTRLEKEIADGFNSVAAAEQTAGMVGQASRAQAATAAAGKPGWLTAGDLSEEAAKRAQAYSQKAQTLRSNVQLKQFQKDSLETNGFFPLKAQDLVDQIDSALKGTTSDMSKQALQSVKEKILSKADENGILSSRDLYENVRKTLNQDIAKYLNLGEQYASGGLPQQAAKAADSVKKFIDASLNRSSDGLWGKYLTSYADYSNRLNRMEVGNFLSQKLQTPLDKERAGAFATAVESAAATIKKSTGIPRYEKLSDVLTEQETATVNAVLADLKRANKADQLSTKLSQLPEAGVDIAKETPALLSRTVAVMRAALEHIQRGNAKEFNKTMAELMMNPGQMAQVMTSGVPKSRMGQLVEVMTRNMDEATRRVFIQSFTVPETADQVGK